MTTTTIPTTTAEENFRKSEELVTQLKGALESTAVKTAIKIIRDACRPRGKLPELTPGLHPDTNLAHYYHFMQGCHVVLDRLERMSRRLSEKDEIGDFDVENEFGHIADDERFKPLPIPE